MSVKRKLVFALLAVCLCLLLAGCGAEAPEPTPEPTATPEPTPEPEILPEVVFSEAQSRNNACFALADGSFPDWVELYNAGEEAAELAGFTLCCGSKQWTIPALTLAPGTYRLLCCDGREAEGHAGFSIPKSGAALRLLSPRGTELDALELPALEADTSYARGADGFAVTAWPTPGYENSEAGYRAFQDSLPAASGLVLGEAMVYNAWYLTKQGEAFDWVELTNTSDEPLELSDYCLSDKGGDRLRFPLPAGTLAPGESRVIYCDKNAEGENFAPFSLSSGGETLYLSKADGTLCDYLSLHDIPYGCSMGREAGAGGSFYYGLPTPGAPNQGGCRTIGVVPEAVGADGVFQDVESVTVELRGEGTIRITTDGSVPTEESPVYDGPITLTETTVLRAVSFVEGRLPSAPLSLSYLINEGLSLPAVSLVGDPADFFGRHGFYDHFEEDWEKPACVMFYLDGESLRLDCGVKLHGATSRFLQMKRSMKLQFRDRYAGPLNGDVFSNGVTQFDSLLLRAAQEADQSTWMRDTLMHELAEEAFPELPAQDHRYCVLFLNGEYWGLYNIREAHSEGHYARHYGYDPDSVSHWHGVWPKDSAAQEIYTFAITHDLSVEENYAYVAAHVNEKSVADWCLMQTYSGNFDFNSPNMRFYYSTEDEQLRFALVDLDLGMFDYGSFAQVVLYGYAYTDLARCMMQNHGFRCLLLSEYKNAMEGPLADEKVLALIDELAEELRPEIWRDRERWYGDYDGWESMLGHLREFIVMNHGRAENVVQMFWESSLFHGTELDEFFPR